MDIENLVLPGTESRLPAILIRPEHPHGAAVIMHGYGGNKEEQLGLGLRVAEAGIMACIFDLRGHGENPLPLDGAIGEDLDGAIGFCRKFGRVTAIGHSLGGRLGLISKADFHIAISPSLAQKYGEGTQKMLETQRSYRVRPSDIKILLELQANLPVWVPGADPGNTLILFAERDVPEISDSCRALKKAGVRVIEVPGATHADIFLNERTFSTVYDQLGEWYGNGF